MINSLDRMQGLMSGKLKPKDEYEEMFMMGFAEALADRLFITKYVEIFHDIDGDVLLLHSYCMGYSLGQQKLLQEIAEFNEDDNKNNH